MMTKEETKQKLESLAAVIHSDRRTLNEVTGGDSIEDHVEYVLEGMLDENSRVEGFESLRYKNVAEALHSELERLRRGA